MRLYQSVLAAGILLGLPTTALAQQSGQTLNDFYRRLPRRNTLGFGPGFWFRTDTTRAATGAGGVVRRFYPAGPVYELITFSNLKMGTLAGEHTRWFENGQVQLREQYRADELDGEQLFYYPDGAVKTRRRYRWGQLVQAAGFTPTGADVAAPELREFPEYPGGLPALLTTIRERTQYPPELVQQNVTGKVVVQFQVDTQGRVQQARVWKSVHPQLDAEALRVVNSLQGWTPGRLNGVPAEVVFGLPVTFTIQ